MSDATAIEWADSTFNPWIGCTKVGPGCDHCYAEAMMDTRYGRVKWGAGNPRVRTSAASWRKPLQWNAKRFMECAACGWRGECAAELIGCGGCGSTDSLKDARRRVFCASLADVFDNEAPASWRERLWYLIDQTPNLDWLVLTKRIGNVPKMLSEWTGEIPHNVWLGATVVNQDEAERDIPKLLDIPARVRFLSCEPLLGPLEISRWLRPRQTPLDDGYRGDHPPGWRTDFRTLGWVVVGGESGANARPMHPDWARSLRNQCQAAGVPLLFKQWGEFAPTNRTMAEVAASHFKHTPVPYSADSLYPIAAVDRVGKKAAGRLLDGREWNEFPA